MNKRELKREEYLRKFKMTLYFGLIQDTTGFFACGSNQGRLVMLGFEHLTIVSMTRSFKH